MSVIKLKATVPGEYTVFCVLVYLLVFNFLSFPGGKKIQVLSRSESLAGTDTLDKP